MSEMGDTPTDTPLTDAFLASQAPFTRDDVRAYFSKLERELARVTAERDAFRKDAERYQWMRDNDMTLEYSNYIDAVLNKGACWPMLDAAIDAALSQSKEQK